MQVIRQEDQRFGLWPRSDLCNIFVAEFLLSLWLLELRYLRWQVEVSEFLVLLASGGSQLLRRAWKASRLQLQLAPASALFVCDINISEAVPERLAVLSLPVELSILRGLMLPLVIWLIIGL